MLDPNTGRTDEPALESLTPIDNSRMGGQTFFESNSLEQLAATQNVKPLDDPRALAGGWPEDEDLDSFLEEIYADRHA